MTKFKLLTAFFVAYFMMPQIVEAQLFPRAPWNTSSCAGSSVSRTGLFSRIAQRRTSRIQSRAQVQSCSGLAQSYAPQQASGCSGSVMSYDLQTYTQNAQIGNLVLNGGVAIEDAGQRVLLPVPVCNGPNCIINPTQSVNPFPQFTPKNTATTPKSEMFGLSAFSDSSQIPLHVLGQISQEQTFGLTDASEQFSVPDHVLAQVAVPVRDVFKAELVKAVSLSRKAGKITARDAVKLRVAMLSPAFVERAHELAVMQVAFSGEASDAVPVDEDGMIQVEGINWEGLAQFLEVFVPLLINLLKAFGL